VSFDAITLCVASQRVFISLSTQSGSFWIHPRMTARTHARTHSARMETFPNDFVVIFIRSWCWCSFTAHVLLRRSEHCIWAHHPR